MPICTRCKSIIIPCDGGAVVTIARVGERETKRLVCMTCAERILEVLRDRAAELAGVGR